VYRQLPVLQLYPDCAFATSLRAAADGLQGKALAAGWDIASQPAAHGFADAAEPRGAGCGGLPLPLAPLPPLETSQPGNYLRRCREELGVSMAALTERTCIRRLDRIEDERYDELPPEPYLRGYVLQYAHALGIPEADALAISYVDRYRRATGNKPPSIA